LVTLLSAPASASAQEVEGWRLVLEPFLWAPVQIQGDARAGPISVEVDADLGDILGSLDWALMLRGEAWAGRFGLIIETYYLATGLDGADDRFELDTGLFVGDFLAAARTLTWRASDEPSAPGFALDLQVGGRLVLLDNVLTVGEQREEASRDVGRFVLGMAVPITFSELLGAELLTAIASPGLEFKLQALFDIHVSVLAIRLGYRFATFEIEGPQGALSITAHGPYLGLALELDQDDFR
jgi:hypothetical protein